jgi:hypothetical protein
MTRSGNRRTALYGELSLDDRDALEDHGQSLAAGRAGRATLRHQRRLPPAATALVQQIGERIFIITRRPRELHHDGLVFFHETKE